MPNVPSLLRGKRIVVTRAAHQYLEFADKLTAKDAIPLSLPMIEMSPINGHVIQHYCERITAFDWLLFTSANAVHTFFKLATPEQITHPKIGVVGQATAKAVEHYDLTVDLIPDIATGQALADALGAVRGDYIWLPRSNKGLPDIIETLQQAEAKVFDVPIYDTVSATPTQVQIEALQPSVDFVTFTSPSCVENLFTLVDNDPSLAELLWYAPDIKHVVIGATTASAYKACFYDQPIVAETASLNGMIAAMELAISNSQ